MLTTTLLTLSLGLPPAGLAPPAPCLFEATQEDAYAALLAEYEAAAEKWKQDVRSADFETRRTLRENPPARVFKPRFDALAEKGEGRALLWLVEEARSWAGGAVKGREAQRGLYPRLLEQHMEAAWFEEVVVSLAGARRVFEDAQLKQMFDRIAEEAAAEGARAQALFAKAQLLQRTDDEKAAEALMKRIVAEYPGTSAARRAEEALLKPVQIKPGIVAPDFTGRTIGGHEFKLSDYRGKVVLLDFYGFW